MKHREQFEDCTHLCFASLVFYSVLTLIVINQLISKKHDPMFRLFRVPITADRQRLTNDFDSDDDPMSLNKNNPVCFPSQ